MPDSGIGSREDRSTMERLLDSFFVISHLGIAALAAVLFEVVEAWKLPLSLEIPIFLLYLVVAAVFYVWVAGRYRSKALASLLGEMKAWQRFEMLMDGMLGVVRGFLNDRYQIQHQIVSQITNAKDNGKLTFATLKAILEEADKERRNHVRNALTQVSSVFGKDDYARVPDATAAVQDYFKVSFYAVEKNGGGKEILRPRWRYYPNAGEPTTREFTKGEGISGLAWERKRIVVCEKGGEDPRFKDMWSGGGQKQYYASLICVPAIEDVPAERISEVVGVLTIDTPKRVGYFSEKLESYWAKLTAPCCELLVYSHEADRLKTALCDALDILATQADQAEATPAASP